MTAIEHSDKSGQDGAAVAVAAPAPARPTRQGAAEREARGRVELTKVAAALGEVEQQHAHLRAELDRLSAAERTALVAVDTASQQMQRCQGAVVAEQAALLIVTGTDGEGAAREALVAAEAALVAAETQHAAAQRAYAGAARALVAARPDLTAQLEETERKIATRRALAQALEEHLARDHAEAGRDHLAALRAEYATLVAQRRDGYAQVDAIEQQLRTFVDGLPQALSAWPELAALPVGEQVEHPLTPARQVLEAFGRYVTTLEANRGGHLYRSIRYSSVHATLQLLDERAIGWLCQQNAELAPLSMLIKHIHDEIARALALFG